MKLKVFKKLQHKTVQAKRDDYFHFLPAKHHFSHEYCVFLHSLLVAVIRDAESSDVVNVHLERVEGDESFFNSLVEHNFQGQELLDHLEKNGKLFEVFEVLYKQVFIALLSDLAHFIYEALECSKKGKLTVTFNLLRKPLVENLLYLEYLLAEPSDFIYKFWKGEIDHFGLGRNETIPKKEYITKIYSTFDLFQVESPDVIHDLRYKKDSPFSFQTYFQRATHLVTQHKYYKTSNTNFNFIFSGDDEKNIQWDGLYNYLPILLMHTFQVVEALATIFGKRAGASKDITQLRAQIGYVLWTDLAFEATKNVEELRTNFNLDFFQCSNCNSNINSSWDNYLNLYSEGTVKCFECGTINDLYLPFYELAEKEILESVK